MLSFFRPEPPLLEIVPENLLEEKAKVIAEANQALAQYQEALERQYPGAPHKSCREYTPYFLNLRKEELEQLKAGKCQEDKRIRNIETFNETVRAATTILNDLYALKQEIAQQEINALHNDFFPSENIATIASDTVKALIVAANNAFNEGTKLADIMLEQSNWHNIEDEKTGIFKLFSQVINDAKEVVKEPQDHQKISQLNNSAMALQAKGKDMAFWGNFLASAALLIYLASSAAILISLGGPGVLMALMFIMLILMIPIYPPKPKIEPTQCGNAMQSAAESFCQLSSIATFFPKETHKPVGEKIELQPLQNHAQTA